MESISEKEEKVSVLKNWFQVVLWPVWSIVMARSGKSGRESLNVID